MPTVPPFAARLKELRADKWLTVKELVERLQPQLWPEMPLKTAIARYNSLESGRLANVTRAECSEFERVLGAEPDELWLLALQDPRKVDPEVVAYFWNELDSVTLRFLDEQKRFQNLSEHARPAAHTLIQYADLVESLRPHLPLLEAIEQIKETQPTFPTDLLHVLRSMLRDDLGSQPVWKHVNGILGLAHLIRGLREMAPGHAQAWAMTQAVSLPASSDVLDGYVFAAVRNGWTLRCREEGVQASLFPSVTVTIDGVPVDDTRPEDEDAPDGWPDVPL